MKIRALLSTWKNDFGGNSIRMNGTNTFIKENVVIRKTTISIKGNANRIECHKTSLVDCRFQVVGDHNQIVVEEGTYLNACEFQIMGSDNLIIIGKNNRLTGTTFWCEDRANKICFAEGCSAWGECGEKTNELAVMGETSISVGKHCLFAGGIMLRTGDSHQVVNLSGEVINQPRSIEIGDHVWIGTRVICLKGVSIASDCVVGAGSLLTGCYDRRNCAIAGNPARVIKEQINWEK